MATRPVSQYIRKAWQDFHLGMNTKDSAIKIDAAQLASCKNAYINKRGLIETAKGYTVNGSPFPDDADSFIRMLHNYKSGLTVDKLLVAALDEGNTDAVYKVDLKETTGNGTYSYIGHTTGTATFTNASATVNGVGTAFSTHLKAGDKIKPNTYSTWYTVQSVTNATQLVLTANYAEATVTAGAYTARIVLHKDYIPRACTFNDYAIIVNGADAALAYTNTSLNRLTTAPVCKYVVPHKSRLFMLGNTSAPSTIYWSAVDDEESWHADANEPVFEYDNGYISGGASFADSLIVFKTNGNMYQVVGSLDDSAVGEVSFIRKIDAPANMGSVFGDTAVVNEDGKLWFLTETGYYTLDRNMTVSPVSKHIRPTIDDLQTLPSATASRAFVYDSDTQWDTGARNAMKNDDSGSLSNYLDVTAISDAKQGNGLCSIAIDSADGVHVAYVDSADGTKVRYGYMAAGSSSITTEAVYTASADIIEVSIAVLSGTDICIGSKFFRGNYTTGSIPNLSNTTSDYVYAHHKTASTWVSTLMGESISYQNGDEELVEDPSPASTRGLLVVAAEGKYFFHAGFSWAESSGYLALTTFKLVGTTSTEYQSSAVNIGAESYSNTYAISGVNVSGVGQLALQRQNGLFFRVTFNYTTFAYGTVETSLDLGCSLGDPFYVGSDGTTNLKMLFSSAGSVKLRDLTAGTTSTLLTDTDKVALGFVRYADTENYAYLDGTNENYRFETSASLANSATATGNASYVGNIGAANNGYVNAFCFFGANAAEILVRRISYRGSWLGPIEADPTLTSWSTFERTATDGGCTITYEVATLNSSPPVTYAAVTNGNTAASDNTHYYARLRITSLLASWSNCSIGRAALNYFGEGVDAKRPVAVLFNGEYLCSGAEEGETANNKVLTNDEGGAWIEHFYPVTCFARYKQRLYAGSSTNGDVLLLNDTYLFDGVSFSLDVTTKEDMLGSLELDKDIYKVFVLYEVKNSGTFNFQYRTDSFKDPTGSAWVSQSVPMDGDGIAEIHVGKTGKSIQFRVTADSQASPVGILGFVVLFHYLNVR